MGHYSPPAAVAAVGACFVREVSAALGDKAAFAGTDPEQWGGDATIDDADLPKLTGVTISGHLTGEVLNTVTDSSVSVWVELSADGGATWAAGKLIHLRRGGGGVSSDRFPMGAGHKVAGVAVTGDVKARVMASTAVGAGDTRDLVQGMLELRVVVQLA